MAGEGAVFRQLGLFYEALISSVKAAFVKNA
jgi:hypothetical protein